MARSSSSFGLRGRAFFQLRCGVTGSPFLSSVIMYVSSPPYAGSASRVRMMLSRTHMTNCLYLALDTSCSSIQKPSTDISFVDVLVPQRVSFFSSPIRSEPRFTIVMPYGVGSWKALPPPVPVTSPPRVDCVNLPPKQLVSTSASVMQASGNVIFLIISCRFFFFLRLC